MKVLSLVSLIFLSFLFFSSKSVKKVARVKISKGSVMYQSLGGSLEKLKKGMWLKEGTVVKTGKRSFAKISFIDKSSMNIGPNSELKIEKFSKEDAGVINVITGKIRSKVTKDYLKIDKDKSKLFIKSKTAVMGVRGTDFMFSMSKKTGAATAVLFEGSVVFSKLSQKDDQNNLESIVDRGRRINPGEFSVAYRSSPRATVPSKMSSRQFRNLKSNESFKESASTKRKANKSVVPPGLPGSLVSSDSKALASEIKDVTKVSVSVNKKEINEVSKGYVKGEDVKPVDGSIVHVDSGTIIPLGIDSKFDSNTKEWVSDSVGTVDVSGNYIPPKGFIINDEGNLFKNDQGKLQKIDIGSIKPLDEVKPLLSEIKKSLENTISNKLDDSKKPDSREELLPPPPQPKDCSTCNQPPTFQRGAGGRPPAKKGRSKIRGKVIKQ